MPTKPSHILNGPHTNKRNSVRNSFSLTNRKFKKNLVTTYFRLDFCEAVGQFQFFKNYFHGREIDETPSTPQNKNIYISVKECIFISSKICRHPISAPIIVLEILSDYSLSTVYYSIYTKHFLSLSLFILPILFLLSFPFPSVLFTC